MLKSLNRLAAGGAAACLAIGLMATTASAAPRDTGIPRGTSMSRSMRATAEPPIVVTCYGASCNGLDPTQTYSSIYGYRCDTSAWTAWTPDQGLAAFSGPRGYVELRYGPYCAANWARISNSSAGTYFWVENSNGDGQKFYVPSGSTTGYTNMINGDGPVKDESGDIDNRTGWY